MIQEEERSSVGIIGWESSKDDWWRSADVKTRGWCQDTWQGRRFSIYFRTAAGLVIKLRLSYGNFDVNSEKIIMDFTSES